MRGRLEPKDTVERFWGLKFIGFPNLSDETPKPSVVVVTTPHNDANSIQKDNHQLISKRQKGAPLSAPYSAYTKVGTFLLHKLVQRITPVHSCTPGFPPH